MPNQIDELELKISSSAQSANQAISALIQNLGKLQNAVKIDTSSIANIGKKIDLSGVSNQAKNVQAEMRNISDTAKTIVKPMEDARKSAADLVKDLNTKFKDFTPVIDFTQSEKSLTKLADKYKQQMTTAQNDINKILASSTADKQTAGIEKLTIKLKEAENGVKAIEERLSGLKVEKLQFEPLFPVQDAVRDIEYYADRLRELTTLIIENHEAGTKMSALPFELELEELQQDIPEAIELIDSYKASIESINQINKNVGGNIDFDMEGWAKNLSESFREIPKSAEENIDKVNAKIQELRDKFKNVGTDFKFEGNIEQINKELDSVSAQLDRLIAKENQFASTGNIDTSKFERLEREISRASNIQDILTDLKTRTESFNQSLQQLKVPEIREENLDKLHANLDKTEQKLEELRIKLANGLTIGKIAESVDDTTFRNMQEQIALTEKQAEALRAKIAQIGQPVAAAPNFDQMGDSMRRVNVTARQFVASFGNVNNALRRLRSGITSAVSGFAKLAKSMLLLNTATRKSSNAFNLNFKTILKYGFGIRSVFVLVNRLRNAIKEGMKNLVQYSSETNASISMLNSSLSTLKNASAAAVSPLLNAIAPALNTLIQLFIKATNAVNQFLSALMGKSVWIKAKDVVSDYADSVSGAANAVKGALQPFDKLNNLTTQQSGGGGIDASDMFETLPVEDKFKDLVDRLKDMWDKADFYDLGKEIGEKLKNALDNIPWDEIKKKARKIGESLATLINGFIEVDGLGYSIGRTLAEIINTAYEFLNGFVHKLNWKSIGKFIADTLNGFFETIDWDLIRDTFVTGFRGLADAINSFIENFHWDNISNTISNMVNIVAESIFTFFSTVDWDELGKNLGEQLMKTIRKIDWVEVGRALGSIVQAALDFLKSFIKELDLSDIAQAFMDVLKGFFEAADAGDVAIAILTVLGIKLALAAASFSFSLAGQAITQAITNSLIPALATGFAKIGAAISGFIGAYILPALAVAAAAVAGWKLGSWIAEKLDLDPQSFNETMQGIKDSFTDGTWKDALKLWGDDIYTAFVTLGDRQAETFNNIKQDISTKLSDIKTNFTQTWEELKSSAVTKFNEIKTSVTDSFNNIKTNLSNGLNAVKSNFVNVFNSIKSSVLSVFDGIKSAASNALDSIKNKLSSLTGSVSGLGTKISSAFKTISLNVQVPIATVPQFSGASGETSNVQTIGTYANGQISTLSNTISGLGDKIGTYAVNTALPYSVTQPSNSAVSSVVSQMQSNSGAYGSGTDISGLASAVYSTGQTEAGLLQTAVALLQMIADKPALSNGDVFDAVQSEYRQIANRGGYTKDPVFG